MQSSLLSFILGLILVAIGDTAGGGHWGYDEDDGPKTWSEQCQTGLRQSPIDIRTIDTQYALMDRINFMRYNQENSVTIAHNGHTLTAAGFDKWKNTPYIIGGALDGKYYLQQFHLHWAHHDHEGSEHKIGGLSYPAELHLVHMKEGLTLQEALNSSDGLAVVGVFLNIADDGEPLARITKKIDDVLYPQNVSKIDKMLPQSLLPRNYDAFYRYEGSLTTPGCNEAVQWIVLAEPLTITKAQLEKLREVRNSHGEEFEKNYRPTQPLNGRTVRFRPAQYDFRKFCSSSITSSFFFTLLIVFLHSLY